MTEFAVPNENLKNWENPIDKKASSDTGVVLAKDAWAVIWRPGQGFSLAVPNRDDRDLVETEALALTMCMLKLQRDPKFLADLADEFGKD